MKKIIIIVLVFGGFIGTASAQQDPQYSQYMFNGLLLNPAYAGSRGTLSATFLFRKQWVGLSGSPQTNTLSIHAPSRNERHGFGLSMYHDRLGITRQLAITGTYAYRVQVGPGILALGLQGGFMNHLNRWSESITVDPDQGLPQQNQSAFLPIVGTGVYYNTNRFYAGISTPNFLKNTYKNPNTVAADVAAKQARHLFATAGVVLKISDALDFKPSIVMKYVQAAPVEFDFNASILYRDMIWFGASYRTGDAVVFIVEYIHKNMFRFGYAYDLTLTKLSGYNSGSHELMLGLDVGWTRARIKTPRYF